jgi:hypothetical protein
VCEALRSAPYSLEMAITQERDHSMVEIERGPSFLRLLLPIDPMASGIFSAM